MTPQVPAEPAVRETAAVLPVAELAPAPTRVPLGPRRVLRDALAYLAGRAVPAALTLLSVPYFVRMLGLELYGRYALFAALSLLAGTVASAWLAQSVLRYHSDFARHAPGAYANSIRTGLLASAAAAGAITLAGGLALPRDPAALALATLVAVTMVLFSVVFAIRQAELDVFRANASDVARTVLVVLVPAVLMLAPALRTPAVVLGGIVAGNVAGLVVAGLPSACRTAPRAPNGRVLIRRMWTFGGPLVGWVLASVLLNLSDRYLIERLLGTESVGAYAAVYDVVFRGVAFAFMPIIMAAHPVIMAEWNTGNRAGAQRTVRLASAGALVLAVAVVAVVGALAGPLTTYVSGVPDALGRSLVLPIAAGAGAWQVAVLVHKPLELRRRTWTMLAAAGLALAVNWGLNLWLLPTLGLVAAAYSTAAAGVAYLTLVTLLSSVAGPAD